MPRFSHHWTDSLSRVFANPPRGSQDIDVADDGSDGSNGGNGTPGDHNNPPGQGGLGGLGGLGGFGYADGSKLKFSHANPLGSWLDSGTGGGGGNGGRGGDAGNFPPHHDYGQPWPGGGHGGDGGDAGMGWATIDSKHIYGFTGTADGDGIELVLDAQCGAGGRGGNGGDADGKNGSPAPGGAGGSGGDGGKGGSTQAELFADTIDHTNNGDDPNHFQIVLDFFSHGSNGGRGGDGGKGGAGSPAGDEGSGGDGGDGGDANINIQGNDIDLSHGGGGSSLLSIVADVKGGNGGNGGAAGRPSGATGLGGAGGASAINFTQSNIHGGAENDTVRLGLHVGVGEGGVSGDGTLHSLNGGGGILIDNCTIDGGGGHNALLFSWAGGDTNQPVSVSLSSTKLVVGNAAGLSFVTGFQDVTGGSADDTIIGDGAENRLNGAGGDDFLQSGLGSDTLTGGAGHDRFVFIDANESTGPARDTITDLNFNQDLIGLDFDLAHVDAAIGGATIGGATFDSDMQDTVTKLKSEHAVLVTAAHGGLKNHVFLVIDVNGVKGYQGGSDIAIDVTGVTGNMTVHDFFNAH